MVTGPHQAIRILSGDTLPSRRTAEIERRIGVDQEPPSQRFTTEQHAKAHPGPVCQGNDDLFCTIAEPSRSLDRWALLDLTVRTPDPTHVEQRGLSGDLALVVGIPVLHVEANPPSTITFEILDVESVECG